METVYVSRRNLLTLLSKLDRKKAGEETHCTLIKRDLSHSVYPSTCVVELTALEDEEFYTDRPAGRQHAADEEFYKEKGGTIATA